MVGGVLPMRTRSPKMAPPENGEEGSMARMPTRSPSRRIAATRSLVSVDLPAPGGPVMPTVVASPRGVGETPDLGRSITAALDE